MPEFDTTNTGTENQGASWARTLTFSYIYKYKKLREKKSGKYRFKLK